MEQKIWKFPMTQERIQVIRMPYYATILYVALDFALRDEPQNAAIWATAPVKDTVAKAMHERTFALVPTGEVYDPGTNVWHYIGSAHLKSEKGQWRNTHIFEVKQRMD